MLTSLSPSDHYVIRSLLSHQMARPMTSNALKQPLTPDQLAHWLTTNIKRIPDCTDATVSIDVPSRERSVDTDHWYPLVSVSLSPYAPEDSVLGQIRALNQRAKQQFHVVAPT